MDLPNVAGFEFRLIEGFPCYAAGTNGEIWSRRRGSWKKLRGMKGGEMGYLIVTLCGAAGQVRKYIHIIILETFVGLCPEGMQARHYPDGNVHNNAVSNLHWGTPKQNSADRVEHGRDYRGEKHHWRSTVTASLVLKIRAAHRLGSTLKQLAVQFPSVEKPNIWCIVHRKSWKHVA